MNRYSKRSCLLIFFLILFFSIVLYFYLRNLTRDVYAGDIGDIATAAYFFGVAHPPGYPTLTFLGFIFSRLPIPIPIISRIALVSTLASLSGLIIYFKFVLEAIGDYSSSEQVKLTYRAAAKNSRRTTFIQTISLQNLAVAILSTGILGFSYYYWLYAEVPEVFALNNFFVIATFYASWKFYHTMRQAKLFSASIKSGSKTAVKLNRFQKQAWEDKGIRYLYLTSFIVGLSMTNQQAIMFAFPGLFVMVFPDVWRILVSKKKLSDQLELQSRASDKTYNRSKSLSNSKNTLNTSKDNQFDNLIGVTLRFINLLKNVIISFLLGLTPYLYVFIAASTNPQINWMKEPTIYNFIRLLFRMDYKFAENLVGFTQRFVIQGIYLSTLIDTYSLILFLIGIMGIFYLFIREKRLFGALLTGFLFAGPIFIFIITPEIIDSDEFGVMERMYIQSFVIFSFFIPFGFVLIQELFYKVIPRRIYGVIFLLPFLIVLIQMIYFNNPKTDLSKTQIGSNYVKDVLGPLSINSIVYLLGDTGTLNTWYVHYVEGYRKDLVFAGSYGDRNDFEKKIYSDFLKENKDTKLSMEEVVISKLPEIMRKRKIYSMYQFPVGKNYMWVPKGLVFELMKIEDIPQKDEYLKDVNTLTQNYKIAYREKLLPSEQNNIAPSISRHYSNAFNHIGDILYIRYNDLSSAFSYYSRAQIIDPQNSLTYAKLGIIQAEFPAQCSLAVENIDTSISMYKIYRPYYTFALKIYNKCKIGENKIKDLKTRYKNLFLKDLDKDPHY